MSSKIPWFLAVAIVAYAGPASAIEFFCQPQDLCEWVPRDGSGTPIYHHGDDSAPWVIGGSDVVQLGAGDYEVGVVPGGSFPIVFVVEDGTLAVEDLGAGEVGIGAWIMLCDHATFRVRNATFRSLASFPFEFPIFAMGQSRVEYEQASFRTLVPAYESAGYHGALFQVMGYESTLSVTAGADYGVQFPVLGDAWELAVVHDATADLRSVDAFGEFYVAGRADFHIEDTQYHDMFFEACPGEDYALSDLPELCELSGATDVCVTPSHPSIDYHTAPPGTPFTLDLVNDKVFAWAISTYADSTISVSNVPAKGNFAVGLGGIHDDLHMKLVPGNPPIMQGIDDRTLNLDNVHVGGWMVWPSGTSHIRLLEGSEVGDLLPGDQVIADAYGTLFTGAMLDSPPGTEMHLFDSIIAERATNSGGKLWATTTRIETDMAIAGLTWLADVEELGVFDLRQGGILHRVSISSPADGAVFEAGPIVIEGTLDAVGPQDVPSPFPIATLEAVEVASGTPHPIASVNGPVATGALASWDTQGLPPGAYDLRLFFAGEGKGAVSTRRIELAGEPAADAGAEGGVAADAAAADASKEAGGGPSASSGGGDDGGGCGCAVRGSRSGWWMVSAALALWWVRRRR